MPLTTVYGLSLSTSWPVVQPSWGSVFDSRKAGRAPLIVYGFYLHGSGSGVGVSRIMRDSPYRQRLRADKPAMV